MISSVEYDPGRERHNLKRTGTRLRQNLFCHLLQLKIAKGIVRIRTRHRHIVRKVSSINVNIKAGLNGSSYSCRASMSFFEYYAVRQHFIESMMLVNHLAKILRHLFTPSSAQSPHG